MSFEEAKRHMEELLQHLDANENSQTRNWVRALHALLEWAERYDDLYGS